MLVVKSGSKLVVTGLCLIGVAVSLQGETAWERGSGFRWQALSVDAAGSTGFTSMAPAATGVLFTNTLADQTAARNQVLLSGSGVALGDVDGDGWCDLYLCRLEGPNALYQNLGGWKFKEITTSSGVACPDQYSTGAAFADLDGDGDLDLLVNGIGAGTRLFVNDGTGRFEERLDSGLTRRYGSICMGLGDLDGDGTVDLYVANYRTTTVRSTGFDLIVSDGRRMLRPEDRDRLYFTPEGFIREYGEPDFCYLNDGTGRFRAMSWTDGSFLDESGNTLTEPPRDWSYSVAVRDLNGDRAPDIYVCGDFWSPDRCWINDGHGRFREASRSTFPCMSSFSMGLDVADINRDGHDDLLVLDMLSPVHQRRLVQTVLFGLNFQPIGFPAERPEVGRNALFLNRGDGSYAEIALLAGLHATEWSWSPVFLDVDLDGYEDVLIPTGHGFDTQDADAEERIRALGPWSRERFPFKLLIYPPLNLPNLAFRNRGDLTFQDISREWRFDQDGISQGTALADLDGDGDLDVVLNNMNSAAALFRNDAGAPRVAVSLEGTTPNTRGIGARIRITGAGVPQSQQIVAGGRFASSDDAMRVFAANDRARRLTIEVTWRDGARSMITNALPNRHYRIAQIGAELPSDPIPASTRMPAVPRALFEDLSVRLGHRHHEEPFDDLARQPALPFRLSQLGPGVSWHDVDRDGWDDLIIGSGRGGTLAVLRNDQRGSFIPLENAVLATPVTRDQTTVIARTRTDGQTELLVGSASYEDGLPMGSLVRRYSLQTTTIDDTMPGVSSSVGPLAAADYDCDGDLDLFAGGRVIPGHYPAPASSFLFQAREDRLESDTAHASALADLGMVSGATWADLTGDGWPELALACEWGPVRIFLNSHGTLREVTSEWGLADHRGWWTGIAAGDFDGDGLLDLVAANWGRNTRYQSCLPHHPVRIYYGEFHAPGLTALVEACFNPALNQYVPWRGLESTAASLPAVREQFSTHRAFAEASVGQILGPPAGKPRFVEASWPASSLLLNRTNRFDVLPLPIEAQFAPAFGVCVADFDGDGFEDVFLSQNLAAVHLEDSPMSSGTGLWLRGDGHGGFTAIPPQASGIRILGEQRGAAVSDYDQDGRTDLAVTENGDSTRLLRNLTGKPGLRVRLMGSPGNPAGIGAVMRLIESGLPGPARSVHAGSGYWSQDSAIQVLAAKGEPARLWVRWPGGRVTESQVPEGAREVQVGADGRVH